MPHLTIRHLLGLALLMILAGCAETEPETQRCATTAECEEVGFVCHRTVCVNRDSERACINTAECIAGEACNGGVCGDPIDQPDLSDMTVDMSPPDMSPLDMSTPDMTRDVVDMPDDMPEDVPEDMPEDMAEDMTPDMPDTASPTITARSPSPDARDVALDSVITITFDEPLDDATATDMANVFVRDASGRDVPVMRSWDGVNLTLTLTPTNALAGWSPFTVTLTDSVTDVAGNTLDFTTWTFVTGASPSFEARLNLAEAYAPAIYQDVETRAFDIPLRWDYDADDEIRNNPRNTSGTASTYDPAVYYSIAETRSHYLIHYILYYPGSVRSSTSTLHHGVHGVLVVVRKLDSDPLGQLEFFQTFSNDLFLYTVVPDCTGNPSVPYCPSGLTPPVVNVDAIDASMLTEIADRRRIRLYAQPGTHYLCHWLTSNTTGNFCTRTAGTFIGSDHATLTVQTGLVPPNAPNFNTGMGTYALYPLPDPWWLRRDSVGDNSTAFYLDRLTYSPASTRPGTGLRLPNSLNTESGQRSGNNDRFSPFAWDVSATIGTISAGQWLIDPADTLTRIMTPEAPFSTDYCLNVYLGIDLTQSDPDCQ